LSGAAAAQEMELRVVLWGPLNTKTSHEGDRVVAKVAQPDNLKGDEVRGTLIAAKSKFHGQAILNVMFDTLVHGGQSIPIAVEVRSVQNSKGHNGVDEDTK